MADVYHDQTKKQKVSLLRDAYYLFENTLNKGTLSIIIWLSILTLFGIMFFGCVLILTGLSPTDAPQNSLSEAFWQSFIHVIDTGAIQGDSNWSYRMIAVVITLFGVFIFSALVGVLTTGLGNVFDKIRKGRSQVFENDYTLILGWTDKVFKIASELIEANANRKHKHIVILAELDKVVMEDELRAKIPDHKTTRIIVRTGNPLDLDDLQIVKPDQAKSVIILAPEVPHADSYVIKAVLALNHLLKNQPHQPHIIAELKEKSNIEAVRFWEPNTDSTNKCYIHSQDLLARITAQTSRQSGYSLILTELLSYEGNEIYFKPISPELIGKAFKDALFVVNKPPIVPFHQQLVKRLCNDRSDNVFSENITVFGVRRGTEIIINPLSKNETFTLQKDDKLIIIAYDDYEGTIEMLTQPGIDETQIVNNSPHRQIEKEKVLIVGWNENGHIVLNELAAYLKNNAEILIIANSVIPEDQIRVRQDIRIQTRQADTADHTELEKLEIDTFDDIIILGYPCEDVQERDAKTLLTLLHLRRIIEKSETGKEINIVSEMSDDRNRRLAEISKACDFIISDNIISTMMAQLSETKELKTVFDELLDESGCEIYLRPVSNYIRPESEINFNTIIQSAASKREIAIGYRKFAEINQPKHYGIHLNPDKLAPIVFDVKDKIIVILDC